jgi:methylmalonic aciduria homocystinuria type C protein
LIEATDKPGRALAQKLRGSVRGLYGILRKQLSPWGLDLLQAFDVTRYNRAVAKTASLPSLPSFGREAALAFLVGNTRALWDPFLHAYQTNLDLRNSPDPLDAYVIQALDPCLDILAPLLPESCAAPVLCYGHRWREAPLDMQRLAEVSGLAEISPGRLAVHPVHGPWIGLRAVLILDHPPPPPEEPPRPCQDCEAPCLPAFEAAVRAGPASQLGPDNIGKHWRLWLRPREVCPVGRENRYGEAQIEYHYTKRRQILGGGQG